MSITLSGCAASRKRPKSPVPSDSLELVKTKKLASAVNRPDPSTLVRVVDGLMLHISNTNKTGYKGVCYNPGKCPNKPYRVAGPQPEQRSLGYYETVVEAAIAYARYIATTPEEFEVSKRHAAEKAQVAAEEELMSRGVLKEFEGLQLHLSAKNSTGYKGVSYKPAAHPSKPYQAVGPQPDGRHLGYFTNSLDAAVAYAKFVESPSLFAANEKQNAELATAAAERSLLERGVILEAQGYKLHLSANRKTGYLGVRYDKHHPNKPYKAEGPASGHKRSLGYHATAVDAAVAYAKYMAHPELYHATDQEDSSGHSSDSGSRSASECANSTTGVISRHHSDLAIGSDDLDRADDLDIMGTQALLESVSHAFPSPQRPGARHPSGLPSPRAENLDGDDGSRPNAVRIPSSTSSLPIAYAIPLPLPEGHSPSQYATSPASTLPMPLPPPSVYAPLTPPPRVERTPSNSDTPARPASFAMRGEPSPPSQSMRAASDDDSPRTLPAPQCEASRAAGDASVHANKLGGHNHNGDSAVDEVSDMLLGIESAFPAAFEQWCHEAYMEDSIDGNQNHDGSTHDVEPASAWKWALGDLGAGRSGDVQMAQQPQNAMDEVRSFWL